MHVEAREFVVRTLAGLPRRHSVIEIGARDINGGVRDLLGKATYTGLDLYDGPGVDVVTDALEWTPPAPVDTVLCLEVLEHAADGAALCARAYEYLATGGVLILTAAGEGRPRHSGIDGGPLREGEPWRPVGPDELRRWLGPFEVLLIEGDSGRQDIYAVASKK